MLAVLAVVNDSTSSMRTTTKHEVSCTSSRTLVNSLCTSLPDSENHFDMMLCELISTSLPWLYLREAENPFASSSFSSRR